MALLCVGVAACAGPDRGAAYVAAYAAGEAAVDSGRFADGAARFDEAARTAKIPRDADHARYLAARALESAGDFAGAAPRLRAIEDASPSLEDAASASLALDEMKIARGDDAGWADLVTTAKRFPSSGIARPALRRAIAHQDDIAGPSATLAALGVLARDLDRTDLAETVAYEIALHLVALGEDVRARDAFVALASRWPYPRGAFWDDALYRASVLDEKLGRPNDAISDLTAMLAQREHASFLGTYERPRYEPAIVRLCALYRDLLHDRGRARACFDRIYTDFTTSELRDDALWEEARLFREDGDGASSCVRLALLVRDFPDSRYVPCSVAQCPGVSRPPKSAAPAQCRPYVAALRLGARAGE
jgi:tetratricopeptide (TPR) repeat protein